ncbi:MAG: hypothetical protein IKO91_01310 [Oscillospiraceae bacterium]|nr:hypothetical protein [Oscillospiraceae bacterium]
MNAYDFSLRQEVLLEKGASVLSDLFRYRRNSRLLDRSHPVNILYKQIWAAKQDVLRAKTEAELEQIDGKFELAHSIISSLEAQNVARSS